MTEHVRKMKTTIYPVDANVIGSFEHISSGEQDLLADLRVTLNEDTTDAIHIRRAVEQLRTSTVPIAFPTETVYGLGADATRSEAVKGIFAAKRRPADNPLIVHFASLKQLRSLLRPDEADTSNVKGDPISLVYHELIRRFWPGPLTIILPVPPGNKLAPEVTAGLTTFGARIPRHPIAWTLIELAGVPIAAPSANASTKPSPTAAEHVAADLDGRIETIIDGGPCAVGVESTVVDGLTSPPLVLRPGGISIDQLRRCPGWENVKIAYHDAAEHSSTPRAPGMKYRHYSPKAPVLLYESSREPPDWQAIKDQASRAGGVALIRTRCWTLREENMPRPIALEERDPTTYEAQGEAPSDQSPGYAGMLQSTIHQSEQLETTTLVLSNGDDKVTLHDIELGHNVEDIARGVFAALRKLDQYDVGAIFVEGIDDAGGDLAAAVMNRLRKAAETTV